MKKGTLYNKNIGKHKKSKRRIEKENVWYMMSVIYIQIQLK